MINKVVFCEGQGTTLFGVVAEHAVTAVDIWKDASPTCEVIETWDYPTAYVLVNLHTMTIHGVEPGSNLRPSGINITDYLNHISKDITDPIAKIELKDMFSKLFKSER